MTSNVRGTLLKAVIAMTFLCINAVLPSFGAQSAFHVNKSLYSNSANAVADIEAAEKIARHDHKRILLDFGGNWCGDCQVLDFYYHQAPNAELLAKYYIVVHVDIGHLDHNLSIANRYHVPVSKGVPALAVLDAKGKLLYSEGEKEFEHTSPEASPRSSSAGELDSFESSGSSHAGNALVLPKDRGQFETLISYPLGEPLLPSQWESPFPVDIYLSWMTTRSSGGFLGVIKPRRIAGEERLPETDEPRPQMFFGCNLCGLNASQPKGEPVPGGTLRALSPMDLFRL